MVASGAHLISSRSVIPEVWLQRVLVANAIWRYTLILCSSQNSGVVLADAAAELPEVFSRFNGIPYTSAVCCGTVYRYRVAGSSAITCSNNEHYVYSLHSPFDTWLRGRPRRDRCEVTRVVSFLPRVCVLPVTPRLGTEEGLEE